MSAPAIPFLPLHTLTPVTTAPTSSSTSTSVASLDLPVTDELTFEQLLAQEWQSVILKVPGQFDNLIARYGPGMGRQCIYGGGSGTI
jgi:hypothetical protein